MTKDAPKPRARGARPLHPKVPHMVFTFEDIRDMASAALRSAGITEIRELPAEHYARYYDSFSHRDNGLTD